MKTGHSGFSAMEMLFVLAVIGILTSIAIPSVRTRIIQQQISASMSLADIAKTPVATSWGALKTFPANNKEAMLPVADKIVSNYISSVEVVDGAINMTYGNKAHKDILGKVLTLRPAVVEDTPIVPVTWVCGYASAPNKMTLKGENKTNIPEEYLPLSCRKQ